MDSKLEEELHSWLHDRMNESDLTPRDKADFLKWLMSRSCGEDCAHGDGKVSFTEVLQLMAWLTSKMNESIVSHGQRRELSLWLKEKLSAHSCLTNEELDRVTEELSGRPV